MWSGYVSKKREERPDRINTICSACHHRLRHTFGTMVGKSNARYRPGRGGHNKSCSVAQIRPHFIPSTCKSTAGKFNQKLNDLFIDVILGSEKPKTCQADTNLKI